MVVVERVYGRLGLKTGATPWLLIAIGVVLALLGVAEALAQAGHPILLGDTEPGPMTGPLTGPINGPINGPLNGPLNGPMPQSGPQLDTSRYVMILPLLALATTLPIALLWNQPVATALLVSGMSVLSITAFQTVTIAGLVAQLVAGYRHGRHGSPVPAVLVTVPFPLLAVAFATAGGADGSLRLFSLLLACLLPAAGLAGIARRARGEAMAGTAARQVVADSLLEHTARGERARIARELHDVVAHHISMVAVQAEAARLAVPGMPEAGAERLSAIGDTARAALTEMRRLLGVLREDTEEEPAWRPQPGLSLEELNELLDESREASGGGTRLILRGAPVELDPGVALAAYRIVQEALTNARRHAPGAAVDVELDYTGDDVLLTVRDNGPGPSEPSEEVEPAGLGLAGMRERAAAVGGELRTGPAPGGGFLVEARLPGKEEDAG